MSERKGAKIAFLGVSAACLVGLLACIICDLAINRSLTWSLYVVYSVPFFWLVTLPLIWARRHKIALMLAVFTAGTLPYLYLLDAITPITGWFFPFGLPVAASSLLALWICYAVFRFLPINTFYKSAISLVLIGIGVNLIVDNTLAAFRVTPLLWWEMALDLVIIVAATVALCVFGYKWDRRRAGQTS